jgi:hypothetical protein
MGWMWHGYGAPPFHRWLINAVRWLRRRLTNLRETTYWIDAYGVFLPCRHIETFPAGDKLYWLVSYNSGAVEVIDPRHTILITTERLRWKV